MMSCNKSFSIKRMSNLSTVYVRGLLNTLRDMDTALNANTTILPRRINIDAPTTIYL